ncbi:hypothetical protein AAIH14_34880, partial [Pseudomonas aeruginosa]
EHHKWQNKVNYVMKVVFPLEILPAVTLLSAMFHALISLGVWFLAYGLFFGIPHLTVLLFPLIVLPFVMFIMGLSWSLASLGVYLRDVSQIIGVGTSDRGCSRFPDGNRRGRRRSGRRTECRRS